MCGAQSTLYGYSLTALINKNPFRDGIVLARLGPESWVVALTSQAVIWYLGNERYQPCPTTKVSISRETLSDARMVDSDMKFLEE